MLGDARDLDVAVERLTAILPTMPADERPGIEGLIARYREDRAAEARGSPRCSPASTTSASRSAWRATWPSTPASGWSGSTPARRRAERGQAPPRPGPRPRPPLRPNARKILAVRIDEVYSYDGLVADPANVTELHDMRIACKRLRYLLEIFGVAFGDDLEPFIDEVGALQDVLGDIHDCDVQIPMLEEHLAWLAGREGGAAQRLVARRAARGREGPPSEAAFREFRRQLEVGRRARRADRRPRADRPAPARARRALRALHGRVAAAEGRALPPAPRGRAGHRCRLSGSPCSATSTPTRPRCAPCSPTSAGRASEPASSRATW